MEKPGYKLGLALSGGGYRAAAFHLGTLEKLHKLGVLEKVDVISTISGGSITGAYYALNKDNFDRFLASMVENINTKNVVKRFFSTFTGLLLIGIVLALLGSLAFLFTPWPWLVLVIWGVIWFTLIRYQFTLLPVSKRIEAIYNQFFYKGASLSDLPEHPIIVVGSTNMQTARPFTFSREWMGDSSYSFLSPAIMFSQKDFPIARAVMASSCVPFAFTPVKIDRRFFWNASDFDRVHPALVDGGVYDNQGIHKVVQRGRYACNAVIVSDASAGRKKETVFRNTFQLLLETVNTFMVRIKNQQMVTDVYENAGQGKREIAYYSLGWEAERCIPGFVDNLAKGNITAEVVQAHNLLPEWIEDPRRYSDAICKYLRKQIGYDSIEVPNEAELEIGMRVGTNLTCLSKEQIRCLMKQASALTEIQVKLYCPSLVNHSYGSQ